MGICIGRGCYTNSDSAVVAPNPNPSNYVIREKVEFDNGYVLLVKYRGCTNFEGLKIMVYEGKYKHEDYLDPHFQEGVESSPVARFRPDHLGWERALKLAQSL